MALPEEPPGEFEVAGPKRVGGLVDARVLGDDVARDRIVPYLCELGVAESRHAEPASRVLARRPPSRVRRVLEPPRDPGVDGEDGEPGRQRHRLDVERTAVDQQRGAVHAEQRRQLVHDPGRNSGRTLLGRLAQARQLDPLELEGRRVCERQRAGDLERGARRKPASLGDGRRDLRLDAHGRATPIGGGAHDAGDQPPPLRPGVPRLVAAVRGDVDLAGVTLGRDTHAPVARRSRAHDRLPVDCHRQDEAVVVVRVVAHQVHTARSAKGADGHETSVLTRRPAVMLLPLASSRARDDADDDREGPHRRGNAERLEPEPGTRSAGRREQDGAERRRAARGDDEPQDAPQDDGSLQCRMGPFRRAVAKFRCAEEGGGDERRPAVDRPTAERQEDGVLGSGEGDRPGHGLGRSERQCRDEQQNGEPADARHERHEPVARQRRIQHSRPERR